MARWATCSMGDALEGRRARGATRSRDNVPLTKYCILHTTYYILLLLPICDFRLATCHLPLTTHHLRRPAFHFPHSNIQLATFYHVYMHTCMHVCMHAYVYTHVHVYMYTCIHVYMYSCIHVYTYTCIHVYVYNWSVTILSCNLLPTDASRRPRLS